jgi:hypothetical protein
MMMLMGGWWIVTGLVAIVDDGFYVAAGDWIFKFNVSAWGWIHLILGIVILAAAFGLLTGALWARIIGVILAVLAGFAAFAWLPWYPVWAILLVAASIAVVWALTAHGEDITAG